MSSHLDQALARVAHAGQLLSNQPTGHDLIDLNKAHLLNDLIHEIKELVPHAFDTLDVDPDTFVCAKRSINAVDEDGELAEVISDLEEATAEHENPREHSTWDRIGTGCHA